MKIRGNTVGTPMKRPDFNQRDPNKSDYIKNNPIPPITEKDEGKILKVVDGKLVFDEDEGGGIDTSDATATEGCILEGKTAYAGKGKITGTIPTYDGSFSGGATIDTDEYNYYDGVYSVTPSTDENITLATKKKKLENNIVIKKIPYAEVSNNSGGLTVSIGD